MTNKSMIYMPLLDEGIDVWRPVEAVMVGNDYLVLGVMPADEAWKFPPGSKVQCETRLFENGKRGLAAVKISN